MTSDYQQMREKVLSIIKAPPAQTIQENYTPMIDVYRDTLVELEQPDRSISVGSWVKFSMLTGGLREKEFTILCGPTGSGKTTLLSNLAVQLVSNFVPVFVASVETGKNDFMKKMISIITGKDAASGRAISKDDLETIESISGKTFKNRNSVFSNYDSRVSHMTLLCDLLHAHLEKGVKVALIDNLNFLMEVTDGRNQNVEMDRAIHDFIVFCKKIPIHVIMVMHPRKTENGRVESEFDIKGSSTAVQEASNVILWNRLDPNKEPPEKYQPLWCREIKFAKVRKRGRSVGSRIIYALDGLGERMVEI